MDEQHLTAERARVLKLRQRYYGWPAEVEPAGACAGGQCCSHRWADDVWESNQTYPPARGAASAMVRCLGCGGDVPSVYLGSSGHCLDCRLESLHPHAAQHLGKSASVIDFRQLRGRR